MKTLNPYLSFGGKCREAMSFYKTCFGGELNIMTVGESPMGAQSSDDEKSKIMHSCLMFEGGTIMATDMSPCNAAPNAPTTSIALDCTSSDEAERLFKAFEDGGAVVCPLGPAFWGGIFGAVTDRYGVNWMMTFNDQAPA
ncbi:MAG: VOC family protein [Armatimonadetes bacterium]|nr:VOC family protein [Armatimonadota bacterium]MBS1728474.1 VOC family protein [Armatimonadota bacterium]